MTTPRVRILRREWGTGVTHVVQGTFAADIAQQVCDDMTLAAEIRGRPFAYWVETVYWLETPQEEGAHG